MKQLPYGITPRQEWLLQRIQDLVNPLVLLNTVEFDYKNQWDVYISDVNAVAKELMYLTETWNKYYKEQK